MAKKNKVAAKTSVRTQLSATDLLLVGTVSELIKQGEINKAGLLRRLKKIAAQQARPAEYVPLMATLNKVHRKAVRTGRVVSEETRFE